MRDYQLGFISNENIFKQIYKVEENYIWKEHGYAHSAKPQMKIRINVLCAEWIMPVLL